MESHNEKNKWKDIVQGFVVNMLEQIGDNISFRVHVWMKEFKRRSIGSLLMLIGLIFFLVALAMIINFVIKDPNSWAGYFVVGVVTILIGFVMAK